MGVYFFQNVIAELACRKSVDGAPYLEDEGMQKIAEKRDACCQPCKDQLNWEAMYSPVSFEGQVRRLVPRKRGKIRKSRKQ